MSDKTPNLFYGAVYFRKSNPPRKDWERDYAQAAKDGMNVFRHWFMWGAIEIAPQVYDWEDYDMQFQLAEKYHIRTVVAEILNSVPEWVYRKHPDYLSCGSDHAAPRSVMSPSSATGGFGPGLCLDNPDAKALAGSFLTQLILRYKDHPAMYGYDLWNECNYSPRVCHCEHTRQAFVQWLQAKYASLQAVAKAWHRYSYAGWEDVSIPVNSGIWPENLDWMEFQKQNAYKHLQWRVDLVRKYDKTSRITAHGLAGSLHAIHSGCDEWLAASKVETYGLTWIPSRRGNEKWKQAHAIDLVRSGARGKPFWHAEQQGGPLWLQPQVIGRSKEDGRVATAPDIRIWNMVSIAGGATGILYPRWRSLLDGSLFGSFGLYSNNGLPNSRTEMGAKVTAWANAPEQDGLFKARPVKGDVGILVVPEAQAFNHHLEQGGKEEFYTHCMTGAYQGFFDNNIQSDWVHIDDMDAYDFLYLPYPIHMTSAHVKAVTEWVGRGGKLVLEGCPAYWGDNLSVGAEQPNYEFAQACGVTEEEVEFMPDLGSLIQFDWKGSTVDGGLFLQSYTPDTAEVVARYADGRVAAVRNTYGKGSILLVGTFPSEGYYRKHSPENKAFFADLLHEARVTQPIRLSENEIRVRLWQDEAGQTFLWAINTTGQIQSATATLSAPARFAVERVLWGEAMPAMQENTLSLEIPAKDVVVLQLKKTGV